MVKAGGGADSSLHDGHGNMENALDWYLDVWCGINIFYVAIKILIYTR